MGSLSLEFTRLSQLTHNPKYYDAVQRITDQLEIAQNETHLPGLWPVSVDAQNLIFPDYRFTVGGMADSTYEYLLKEHILLGGLTDQYRRIYGTAMDSINKHLLFRAMTKDGSDLLFAGNARATPGSTAIESQVEHLKCFLGGMVAMGAKIFERPEELHTARRLVDGCIWAYDSMPTGVMPEIFFVSACDDLNGCEWNEKKWHADVLRLAGSLSTANVQKTIDDNQLQPGVQKILDSRYLLR